VGEPAPPHISQTLKKKMDKKFYVAPMLEQIKIDTTVIMAGSPGAGINSDYSASTGETPEPEQPTGW
jgi:hypothetical protein